MFSLPSVHCPRAFWGTDSKDTLFSYSCCPILYRLCAHIKFNNKNVAFHLNITFCIFKINANGLQATCSARNRSSVRVLCAGLLGTGVILTVWRRAVHWCVALAQPSRTWRALRTHVLLSCAERRITFIEGGFKPFCTTCRNPDSFESPCDAGYLGRYPTSCGSPRSGLGITDMELREMLIKKS